MYPRERAAPPGGAALYYSMGSVKMPDFFLPADGRKAGSRGPCGDPGSHVDMHGTDGSAGVEASPPPEAGLLPGQGNSHTASSAPPRSAGPRKAGGEAGGGLLAGEARFLPLLQEGGHACLLIGGGCAARINRSAVYSADIIIAQAGVKSNRELVYMDINFLQAFFILVNISFSFN